MRAECRTCRHTALRHRQQSRRRTSQRGFGLLVAIFVLVIGAAIGATLASVLGGANQVQGVQLGAQRARFAARAGLEWARYRITQTNACAATVLNLGASAGALLGFRVTVTCASTAHNDGGTARTAYVYSAFAQYANFGSPDYVSSSRVETLVR